MKQMKTILPQWNKANLNNINENFKSITDHIEGMGDIPKNEDLIITEPKEATSLPSVYEFGFTTFFTMYNSSVGKTWSTACSFEPSGNWIIQVETLKTDKAITQTVLFVDNYKIVGKFSRAAYISVWGPFEKQNQNYNYTASTLGGLYTNRTDSHAIEVDYEAKTLRICRSAFMVFRDGYRFVYGVNSSLPEDIVYPFSELGTTGYCYLFCKRVYETPEDNTEAGFKVLSGSSLLYQTKEFQEKWCYLGFFKNNSIEQANFPMSDVRIISKKFKKTQNISFLGDSITTYSGYIPSGNAVFYPKTYMNSLSECWWKQLIDSTKSRLKLLVNNSWSGSRVTGTSTSTSTGVYRADLLHSEVEDPDIIIVYIGINDFNNNVDLGSYDGTGTFPTQMATFSDAYTMMLNKMTQRYGKAKIYCCTLPFNDKGGFPRKNTKGILLDDYNARIRLLARFFGAEIIELDKIGVNQNNSTLFLGDGLHPNVAGMDLIFKKAKEALRM